MSNIFKTSAGAALIGITITAAAITQAFADKSTPVEPGEVFDECASYALDKTPEARGQDNMSAIAIGEDFVEQNGTRLQIDGKGGVTASGPGAETALRQFDECYNHPNLTL